MNAVQLFWSRSGEIACVDHAPLQGSERWTAESWQPIPPPVGAQRRPRYQCQHCSRRPISHARVDVNASPMIVNVDDRPSQLYARDRILRLHGFTVTNVDTVKAAYETVRQLKPNLVLLDIHLPDGDGRELCQRMKGDADLSHIPVVLISSTLRGHANQLETIRWGGADAFIQEPVTPEVMVSTIRKVIGSTQGA